MDRRTSGGLRRRRPGDRGQGRGRDLQNGNALVSRRKARGYVSFLWLLLAGMDGEEERGRVNRLSRHRAAGPEDDRALGPRRARQGPRRSSAISSDHEGALHSQSEVGLHGRRFTARQSRGPGPFPAHGRDLAVPGPAGAAGGLGLRARLPRHARRTWALFRSPGARRRRRADRGEEGGDRAAALGLHREPRAGPSARALPGLAWAI